MASFCLRCSCVQIGISLLQICVLLHAGGDSDAEGFSWDLGDSRTGVESLEPPILIFSTTKSESGIDFHRSLNTHPNFGLCGAEK